MALDDAQYRAQATSSEPLAPLAGSLNWLLYGAAWLVSIISVLAFRAARMEADTSSFTLFLILFITLGTLLSALLSQRPLSETTRLVFGFLDATLALFTITAQPSFNALVNMPTDSAIEIYLSTSLLWYLALRTPLMVSPPSVLFQNVPVMALFGLIGSYLFAPAVPYLFLAFIAVLLAMLILAHQMELRVQLPLAVVGRYALLGSLIATVGASGLALLLWLMLGELVSGLVIGLPFRTPGTGSRAPAIPALQVGAGPLELSDTPVLRVRFLQGSARYLRADTYDQYTGRGWNRTYLGMRLIEAGEQGEFVIVSNLSHYPHAHQVHAEITVLGGIHQQFFSPGMPLWLKPFEQRRAIRVVYATGTIWVRRPLTPGTGYEIRALVSSQQPALLREREAITPFWGSWITPARNARVMELAQQLTADQPTDYDKVMALKRYIETHAAYNVHTEAYPSEVDVVEHFLFEAKQGYCIEFATALAVMCQYVGLPARVVSGYLLQERDPDTGDYIVRERHRHLWTEVYFEGVGWVPFDATENARVIDGGDSATGSAGSESARRHPLYRWRRLLDGLIAAGLIYLLWSVLFSRWLGDHRSLPIAYALYMRLVYWLRLMGCPAPLASQSPNDYLQACLPRLGEGWRDARRAERATALLGSLREPLLRLLYAPPLEARAVVAEVQGKLKALQRVLRQELGYFRLIGRAARLLWLDGFASASRANAHSDAGGGTPLIEVAQRWN